MTWHPHVTVAAIVEREGKFLVVKENPNGKVVYNQPAGHLEKNESLAEAISREVREETAWRFSPEFIVGVYRMHIEAKDITYVRVCFAGSVDDHKQEQPLDDGIIEATWMSREELINSKALRSPLVIQCINDYLQGCRYETGLLKDIGNV